MAGELPVFVTLKATIADFQAKMGIARGELDKLEKKHTSTSQVLAKTGGLAMAAIAGGAAAVGVASVKMAGDFQESMTSLVTGAGESQANIKKVSDGILAMAPKVGESTSQLASGMYMIESAGYHGASGLNVLQAAAEGAKVGSADLGTVADAVTTALNDYKLPASQAATVTSQLVATVAAGKTHMQDLAGALASVLPAASAANISLGQVLGAMATMTSKGTPAADAATYLRQTILQLSNPSAKAATEMKGLGLNAVDISSHLGERGLTGTLKILTDAIQAKMGPAGTVMIDALQKSAGKTTDFQKVLANLPPAQQTFIGALADMVGGTKSMQAALELTGASADTFQGNVKTISTTTADAKGNVQGWSDVQKDFNQKLAEAKASVEVMAIKLGTQLIPVIENVVKWVGQAVTWFQKHKDVALLVASVVGGVLVVAIAAYTINMIAAAAATIAAAAPMLAIIGVAALVGAAVYLLLTNWGKVWAGIKFITGMAVAGILTFIRVLGDGFFDAVQAILGAASHLPFVGHYFKVANDAVKGAHEDFDKTMTGWATDATHWGDTIGSNTVSGVKDGINKQQAIMQEAAHNAGDKTAWAMTRGIAQGLDSYMGPVLGRVPTNYMGPVLDRTTHSGAQTAQVFTQALGNAFDSYMGPVLGRIPTNYMGPVLYRSTQSGAQVGQDLGAGVGVGLSASQNQVVAQANLLISNAIHAMHFAAQSQSPSKLTIQIGEDLALGVGIGLLKQKANTIAAANQFVGSVAGVMITGAQAGVAGLAMQMAAARGWTGPEWQALNAVEMREAGWSLNAKNPSSGAYGIAQFINGPLEYYTYGGDPNTPAGQITGFLNYIAERYGRPSAAWQHELAFGWYDQGGILPPGLSLALNTSGRNEYVVGAGGASSGGGITVVLELDGKTLGNVVLTQLLREQQRRPLGIRAS
jgi:TP901 family phage tail tape measure protein